MTRPHRPARRRRRRRRPRPVRAGPPRGRRPPGAVHRPGRTVDRLADIPLPDGAARPAHAGPGAVPADRRARLRLRRRRRAAGVPADRPRTTRIALADALGRAARRAGAHHRRRLRHHRRGVRRDRASGCSPRRSAAARAPTSSSTAPCDATVQGRRWWRRWPRCAGCCSRERGAYWTFVVHTGTRTLVGASPERHVSVDDGLVMMNPISGTFRHAGAAADRDGAAALPRRPEGGRGAVHGARRGAEDDGHRRRARRPGDRAVPEGDVAPRAHRVPARRARLPGRPGGAAGDDVRPDGDRQPDGERLPGDRPARAHAAGATTPGCSRCSAATTPAGRRSTRRS